MLRRLSVHFDSKIRLSILHVLSFCLHRDARSCLRGEPTCKSVLIVHFVRTLRRINLRVHRGGGGGGGGGGHFRLSILHVHTIRLMRDFRGVSLHLLKDSGRRDVIWALCQLGRDGFHQFVEAASAGMRLGVIRGSCLHAEGGEDFTGDGAEFRRHLTAG